MLMRSTGQNTTVLEFSYSWRANKLLVKSHYTYSLSFTTSTRINQITDSPFSFSLSSLATAAFLHCCKVSQRPIQDGEYGICRGNDWSKIVTWHLVNNRNSHKPIHYIAKTPIISSIPDKLLRMWDIQGSHPQLVRRLLYQWHGIDGASPCVGLTCYEEWPQVEVEFEETLLGHDSPITHCRFSAYGSNIATASADGMIRIWTVGTSLPIYRTATLHFADEIMCLNWKHKSGSLLLIGTKKGGIKVWTVDTQRLVFDLSKNEAFPCIFDLQCCPRESWVVSAASSSRVGGFASLTTRDMITKTVVTKFPLPESTIAMTSLSLNDNGTNLVAGGCDGIIRVFDLESGHQLACWSAHQTPIHCVNFGYDDSIFSMGSDGKISEWTNRKHGHLLRSRGCIRDSGSESKVEKHEMALDATQSRLLVTSDAVRAPIYEVRRATGGYSTQAHRSAITSVGLASTLVNLFDRIKR